MVNGVPILDYTPQTLLGITILSLLFGWIVPYRVVKQLLARIAYLESALEKEQIARAEDQETSRVVRHFFNSLSRGADL